MATMIVALILLCTGSECTVVDGYPMGFGSEADCRAHLDEMADEVDNSGEEDTEVVMICSSDIQTYNGTLPGAK